MAQSYNGASVMLKWRDGEQIKLKDHHSYFYGLYNVACRYMHSMAHELDWVVIDRYISVQCKQVNYIKVFYLKLVIQILV